MTEEVRMLEDEQGERSCQTCKWWHLINSMGMTADASKLVQTKCLMCRYSKIAGMIAAVHASTGVERELEDNWDTFEG